MTYQELKTKVVDENKSLSKREFNKLLLYYSLFSITLTLCMLVLVLATLPIQSILLVLVIMLALYLSTVNSLTITEINSIKTVQRLNKIWWLPLILLIVEVGVLKYLGFI